MTYDAEVEIFAEIRTRRPELNRHSLEQLLTLAVEIAREGREGRKVGTLFVMGDAEAVLACSTCLILDPLAGHPQKVKHIDDPDLRETVKELAQLDGAFVLSDQGIVLSAARYLNSSSLHVKLPLGLGSRHMAAASITYDTQAVAVVVSESAVVRVFDRGEIIGEIIPELWLLSRYSLHLKEPYSVRSSQQLTVASRGAGEQQEPEPGRG